MPASPALQAARRAEGLCPVDGRPAAPFARCAECRAAKVRASKKAYRRAANNLNCVVPGCLNTRYLGHKRCDACREVEKAKAAKRREERRQLGLCAWGCGRKATVKRTCGACRQSQRARDRAKRGVE